MKNLNFKTLTLMSTFLTLSSLSSVVAAPHFLWDNQEGVISKDQCSIKRIRKNDFRLSRYVGRGNKETENLRNYNGVLQSHLINSSMVKIISGKSKRNYEKIEVVGINTETTAKANRWFSERGDKGYLFHESILPIEDFVFELDFSKNDLKLLFDKANFKGAVEDINLEEKLYLRVAADSSYYSIQCGEETERDYLIFRGYQKEKGDTPLFLLGVSTQETSLFKSFGALKKTDAMKFLADVGNEEALVEGEIHSNVMLSQLEVEKVSEEEKTVEEDIIAEAEKSEEPVAEIEQDEADSEEKNSSIPTVRPTPRPADLKVVSSMQKIVCIGTNTLNVRNKELDKVLFKAKLGEEVKVFQSFDGDTVEKVINGTLYTFKKVEFSSREEDDEKIGYVAAPFISAAGDCRYIRRMESADRMNLEITGLDDPNCCDFPTVKKPTHSFTSGMRRFRAGRSGGRLHAACDLYRYKNEPIKSVAPGKVISDLYYFYQGTYALEIRHSGGFVARYGEITGRKASGVRKNANVRMGQRIGYMGKVNSNCCRPMLHFELYSGSKRGSLSTSRGRYKRRSDLLDPTRYLTKWKNEVF